MAGEWRTVRIEDIAEKIAMGPFASDIKTDNFVPKGVPVIRGVNLTNGRFNGKGFVFFDVPKPGSTQKTVSFGIWPAMEGKTGPKKGKAVVTIRAPRDALAAARLVAESKPLSSLTREDLLLYEAFLAHGNDNGKQPTCIACRV